MTSGLIYVVEDEPSIAEVVSLYLRRADFEVVCYEDGQKALQALESRIPDLLVLDLMLPNVDGLAITRYLRDRSDAPIIMLTARRAESDRIAGLEMGADDYVVKPFSPQELVSRVRAVLRRTRSARRASEPGGASGGRAADEKALVYGDLTIDPLTRLVAINNLEITLTAKEFDMLWALARHPRQVFSRDQLLERVWGLAEYIDPSTVTVHVRRLREKIEKDPSNPARILTVWGVGYKFEP